MTRDPNKHPAITTPKYNSEFPLTNALSLPLHNKDCTTIALQISQFSYMFLWQVFWASKGYFHSSYEKTHCLLAQQTRTVLALGKKCQNYPHSLCSQEYRKKKLFFWPLIAPFISLHSPLPTYGLHNPLFLSSRRAALLHTPWPAPICKILTSPTKENNSYMSLFFNCT